MGIGNRIGDARRAKMLRQEDVAAQLGVTKMTVSKWENDIHNPNPEQIVALCNVLAVTPNWLFQWAGESLPPDALEEARAYAALSPEDRRKWRTLRRAMFTAATN